MPALLFPVKPEPLQKATSENHADKGSVFANKTKYPEEIVQLIAGMKIEIDQLYSCMTTNLVSTPENEDYKEAILKCFKTGLYEKVKEEYLTDDFLYYYGEKEFIDNRHLRRDFIGKLCQIIISDHFPKRLPEKNKAPKRYSAKKLYEELYKKL